VANPLYSSHFAWESEDKRYYQQKKIKPPFFIQEKWFIIFGIQEILNQIIPGANFLTPTGILCSPATSSITEPAEIIWKCFYINHGPGLPEYSQNSAY